MEIIYEKSGGFECCRFCINNPANNPNASGICWCSLPDMEMSRTAPAGISVTTVIITTGTENGTR